MEPLPSNAHRELAERYCTACEPGLADCQTQFYAKKSGLPGGLVLPYAEAIASEVSRDCTAGKELCRGNFVTCASRIIGRALGGELSGCVVASFLLDDAASSSEVPCTPENCKGCCREGRCEAGASELACGAGGGACQACTSAQRCADGACKESCGPANCNGCCSGGQCLFGTAVDSCGEGGVACANCTTAGSRASCIEQRCVDPSCAASCETGCCTAVGCQSGKSPEACGADGKVCSVCPYGHLCNGFRKCAIDPGSTWDLNVVLATFPATNNVGASWDTNGAPADPYVVMHSSLNGGSHTGRTSTRANTRVPYWEEATLKAVSAAELSNAVSFELWDSDPIYDDLIGGCALTITPELFDGALHTIGCKANEGTVPVELTFRLKAASP